MEQSAAETGEFVRERRRISV